MEVKLTPEWLRFLEGEDGAAKAPDNATENGTDNDGTANKDSAIDWEAKYKGQLEVNRKLEARAKANKDAADKLAELEDRDKTDLERAQAARQAAEQQAAEARAEVARYKVAAEFGLSPEDTELLATVSDEDTLHSLAKRLGDANRKSRHQAPPGGRDRTPPAPDLKSGADLFARVKNNL